MDYKIIDKEIFYSKDNISLQRVTHTLPNGKTAEKAMVDYPQAVAAIVEDKCGDIVLVSQYRVGADQELWEIPAGKIDPQENPDTALQRELQEEIGYIGKNVKKIFSYYPAPGISSEYMHLYWVSDLQPSQDVADDDEFIEASHFSRAELQAMIAQGAIQDAKTFIALLWFLQNRPQQDKG